MSELMLKLAVALQTLRAREEGQGLVEYALILVVVSIAAVITLGLVSTQVDAVFTAIAAAITP